MNRITINRAKRAAARVMDLAAGPFTRHRDPLADFAIKPVSLGLELSNICNADCIFCPYQFQTRARQVMSDAVFYKAVADFIEVGGGDIDLTPIVGDSLIDPDFVPRVRFLRAQPQIDQITLITNGILLDRHGIEQVLDSGINAIGISTAGFDEPMYERVYRNKSYQRMRRNVLDLCRANQRLGRPVKVEIYLRPDREMNQVLADPDFAEILATDPIVGAQRLYSDFGGRITAEQLPRTMPLRVLSPRSSPCAQTYWGPVVLSDGTLVACNCFASMDAGDTLGLGNILQSSLIDMWHGEQLRRLRKSFTTRDLNATCRRCTAYHPTSSLYRASERRKAAHNRARYLRAVSQRAPQEQERS